MASVTWWISVWASSRSWWWTGKPGVLQSMGSQRFRHTEQLNWTDVYVRSHLLCCWIRVFAMITAFFWQNSVSLCLLHFVLQGQTCLLLQVSLDFLLLHSSPLWWKGHLFLVLVLEGIVGHHRTVQLQLLQHWWLGHGLGLLWYWIVFLRNE